MDFQEAKLNGVPLEALVPETRRGPLSTVGEVSGEVAAEGFGVLTRSNVTGEVAAAALCDTATEAAASAAAETLGSVAAETVGSVAAEAAGEAAAGIGSAILEGVGEVVVNVIGGILEGL